MECVSAIGNNVRVFAWKPEAGAEGFEADGAGALVVSWILAGDDWDGCGDHGCVRMGLGRELVGVLRGTLCGSVGGGVVGGCAGRVGRVEGKGGLYTGGVAKEGGGADGERGGGGCFGGRGRGSEDGGRV